jgi:hypothetical protein
MVSGVVDENVDAAELDHGLSDDRLAVAGVLDVTAHKYGFAAFRFNQLLGGARILILFKIGDQEYRRLRAHIGDGHGAPMPLSPPVMSTRLPLSRPEPL